MTAVITLKAGPAALGLFAALALGSQAVTGLFAGPLVDRLPKRWLLIGADLGRACVLTLVPLTAALGWLSLGEIYLAGALMGVFNVVFDVADHAFLPSVIAPAELMEGNSKLATTDAVAEVGGPALYGLLFSIMIPPLAIAVNAVTYLVSALFLGRVRASGRPAAAPAGGDGALDLLRGFRIVLAHPLARPLWLADVTQAFFGSFFAALYLLFAVRWLHLSQAMVGATVACGGIGGLVGAMAAPALTRRLGIGPMILLTGLAGAAMTLLIPLARGAPLAAMGFLMVAQLVGDGLQTASGIGAVSLRQSVLPPEALGRAGGAFASGQAVLGVAGALAGGMLGGGLGPRETLLIAALGITSASLFVLASPLRRLREAVTE
jgi:hypothetical protein